MSQRVGLRNVRVVHQRVEEYQANPLFDSLVSRAFGTLHELLHVSQHLVKAGGQILAMKGVYPKIELQEVVAPFKLRDVYPIKIPNLDLERHLVNLWYEPEMQLEKV